MCRYVIKSQRNVRKILFWASKVIKCHLDPILQNPFYRLLLYVTIYYFHLDPIHLQLFASIQFTFESSNQIRV